MSVDFDRFLDWAENRFPVVQVRGSEIKIDSIFAEDNKQHMWCNPYGGKNNRENGVFHCWKTDKHGSLVTLVMLVDHCSYEEALEILDTGDASMMQLEKELEIFLNEKYYSEKKEVLEIKKEKQAGLPDYTYPILELSPNNLHRVQAEVYLFNRKLSAENLYICINGRYKNRIIIPYYDKFGKLIYWNGRYIGNRKDVIRYQGPDKEDFGIGKEDVLFIPSWPDIGSRIYLTEGEFDAITLKLSELNSGAFGGKNLSDSQMVLLRDYRISLCLDNDSAGKGALPIMGNKLKAWGFVDVRYVRPPQQFKDWNKMLENTSPKLIHAYIRIKEKPYTSWTGEEISIESIN
jgi:DNA primase